MTCNINPPQLMITETLVPGVLEGAGARRSPHRRHGGRCPGPRTRPAAGLSPPVRLASEAPGARRRGAPTYRASSAS